MHVYQHGPMQALGNFSMQAACGLHGLFMPPWDALAKLRQSVRTRNSWTKITYLLIYKYK